MKGSKMVAILLFVALILAVTVGYAAFSDNLKITGTANAGGNFDLEFTSDSKVVQTKGVDADETKVTVSEDKNTLTVVVKDLAYPGAGAKFQAVIKNNGTIAAKVKRLTENTNTTGADSIKITGLEAPDFSSVLEPGDTTTIEFTVEWDSTKDLTNANGDTVSFELGMEYEQATESI